MHGQGPLPQRLILFCPLHDQIRSQIGKRLAGGFLITGGKRVDGYKKTDANRDAQNISRTKKLLS